MKKRLIVVLILLIGLMMSTAEERNYYTIKFKGPIEENWKTELSEKGITLTSYIPDYSFITSATPSEIKKIGSLEFIDSITEYKPKTKYAEYINKKTTSKQKNKFYVVLQKDADKENSMRNIKEKGIEIIENSEEKIRIYSSYDQLKTISELEEVSWIEEVPRYKIMNDQAATIINADTTEGYRGRNQTVAISDTGVDTADDNITEDFRGKITIFNWFGGTADDTNGHGTHTTGSMAGSGNSSGGAFKGIAAEANIVFQGIGDDEGSTGVYPPINLSDLFIQAYENGARVHSNSWGSEAGLGDYTSDSQTIDDFMWNYTNFLIVFAAGNTGPNLNTVEFPSTCKNCLSIGATENNRPSKGSLSDNINEAASFSSRGPTDDGRIKPDLVAPGTYIVSTKSSRGITSCVTSYEENINYSYCSGTSMATPIAAGAAAIIREYYEDKEVNASAALVKATLINGAMDIGYGIPSNETGWGRINLTESTNPEKPKSINYTEQQTGLNTGESKEFTFQVYNESIPLKITLVWTDYPGELSAGKKLVNDLNMVITTPDNSIFNGNDMKEPFNNEADNTNNVEQVNISNLTTGTYGVNISAYNVPVGVQTFALVASGAITPLITLTTENNTVFTSQETNLTFSVDENYNTSNCSLYLNGELNETKNITNTEASFEQNLIMGTYNWSVQCDNGEVIESETFFFTIDLSPTIIITNPENITYPTTTIELNFSTNNPSNCWYNLGEGNTTIEGCANTTINLNETEYNLYLYTNNSGGLENYSRAEFRTDITNPEAVLISPTNDTTWNSADNITFIANITDAEIDNCSLILNENTISNNDTAANDVSFENKLENGEHNWKISCMDKASNSNTSETYKIIVNYAPQETGQTSSGGSGGGGSGGGGGKRIEKKCEENWECMEWGECNGNVQKRVCNDKNDCETADKKPLTIRECTREFKISEKVENKEEKPEGKAEEKQEQIPKPVEIPKKKINVIYIYTSLVVMTIITIAALAHEMRIIRKNKHIRKGKK